MAEKTKILVVDDEEVILEATKKILSVEGFLVCTATDAESALDILRAEVPDMALVDLKLPGLSGMELLEIGRRYPQLAVIMMTGYSTLSNAIAFLKAGAFDFLPKPFTYEELLSCVQRAGRLATLPAEVRRRLVESLADRYRLGLHSWAKTDPEGTVLLGISELFRQTVGQIRRIELPAVNAELRQGGPLVQIVAEDDLKHTVWSALSGRVIATNPRFQETREMLSFDAIETGWLVRLIPDSLEIELMNLTSERKRDRV